MARAVRHGAVAQAQLHRVGFGAHLGVVCQSKDRGCPDWGHVDGQVLHKEALRHVDVVANVKRGGSGAIEAPDKVKGPSIARMEADCRGEGVTIVVHIAANDATISSGDNIAARTQWIRRARCTTWSRKRRESMDTTGNGRVAMLGAKKPQ